MNNQLIKLLPLLIGLFFVACQDFEELNENPNEPTEVNPDVLLNSSIKSSVDNSVDASFLLGNNIGQLTAKTLRTEVDDYNWNSFPTVWEGFYESLTDVREMEKIGVDTEDPGVQGIAIVMRSWIISILTNAYGDIPYSEAIQGDENLLTPVYDEQEEIYLDMLEQLAEADNLLSQGETQLSNDILFGGDLEAWRKFGNSLRLRLIMTASNQMSDPGSRFAEIVNNSPIITNNSENAALSYTNSFPNEFYLVPLKTGDFDAVAVSSTLVDVLGSYDDPRLMRYARPDNEEFNENAMFSGADNGRSTEECDKSGSRLGVQYYNYPDLTTASDLEIDMAEGVIMTYAEVEFLIAEAAAKGWISNDVETHYRNGILASMEYHQVNLDPFGWDNFEDFYQNSGVAYSETTDIWEQKWINSYFHGLEPYFEVRRWYTETGEGWEGIPFLEAPCANVNDDVLPMRFPYPGEEQSLNAANYQEAVDRLGGSNSIDARMWIVQN